MSAWSCSSLPHIWAKGVVRPSSLLLLGGSKCLLYCRCCSETQSRQCHYGWQSNILNHTVVYKINTPQYGILTVPHNKYRDFAFTWNFPGREGCRTLPAWPKPPGSVRRSIVWRRGWASSPPSQRSATELWDNIPPHTAHPRKHTKQEWKLLNN